MDSELKLKFLVYTVLLLPFFWFAWNQVFKYFKFKKRACIQHMCLGILLEINTLSMNPEIDKNSPEARKLVQKEEELWVEYKNLVEQEKELEKYL